MIRETPEVSSNGSPHSFESGLGLLEHRSGYIGMEESWLKRGLYMQWQAGQMA